MTVRDLIRVLLEQVSLDSVVYVGKGMGPVGKVESEVTDRVYVVITPVKGSGRG